MCFIISLKWLQKFILDPLLYAIFGWTTLYGYRSKGKLLKWMSKCKGAGSKYACKKIMLCNILPMNEGNYCYFFFLFFWPFQVKNLRNLHNLCESSIEGIFVIS